MAGHTSTGWPKHTGKKMLTGHRSPARPAPIRRIMDHEEISRASQMTESFYAKLAREMVAAREEYQKLGIKPIDALWLLYAQLQEVINDDNSTDSKKAQYIKEARYVSEQIAAYDVGMARAGVLKNANPLADLFVRLDELSEDDTFKFRPEDDDIHQDNQELSLSAQEGLADEERTPEALPDIP